MRSGTARARGKNRVQPVALYAGSMNARPPFHRLSRWLFLSPLRDQVRRRRRSRNRPGFSGGCPCPRTSPRERATDNAVPGSRRDRDARSPVRPKTSARLAAFRQYGRNSRHDWPRFAVLPKLSQDCPAFAGTAETSARLPSVSRSCQLSARLPSVSPVLPKTAARMPNASPACRSSARPRRWGRLPELQQRLAAPGSVPLGKRGWIVAKNQFVVYKKFLDNRPRPSYSMRGMARNRLQERRKAPSAARAHSRRRGAPAGRSGSVPSNGPSACSKRREHARPERPHRRRRGVLRPVPIRSTKKLIRACTRGTWQRGSTPSGELSHRGHRGLRARAAGAADGQAADCSSWPPSVATPSAIHPRRRAGGPLGHAEISGGVASGELVPEDPSQELSETVRAAASSSAPRVPLRPRVPGCPPAAARGRSHRAHPPEAQENPLPAEVRVPRRNLLGRAPPLSSTCAL